MTAIAATPQRLTVPPYVQVDVTGAPSKPTSIYSSNFTAGVDGFTGYGTGVTLINDTAPTPDALKMTGPAGTLGEVHAARLVSGLSIGVGYRMTAWLRTLNGQARLAVREAAEGSEIAWGAYVVAASRGRVTVDFTATATSMNIEVFTKAVTAQAGKSATVWADTITVDPVTWQGTTITRTDASGTHPVRLLAGQDTTGGATGLSIRDYEAPLVGDITYKVTDGNGGTASVTIDATTIPVPATASFVEVDQPAKHTSATPTITLVATPQAGDLLILWATAYNTVASPPVPSGLGATWAVVPGAGESNSSHTTYWFTGKNATAPGTVTVTWPVSKNGLLRMWLIRGLSTWEVSPTKQRGTSVTTLTGSPVNGRVGHVVISAGMSARDTGATIPQTLTPATGWTNGTNVTSMVAGQRNTAHRVVSETSDTAHNMTIIDGTVTSLCVENLLIGAPAAAPPTGDVSIAPSLTLPATGLIDSNLDPPDYAPVTMAVDYTEARDFNGAVHIILGREDKLSNPGPLSARAGTLELFALDYEAAAAIRALLAKPQVAMFRQADYVGMDLYFQARTVAIRPAEPTPTRHWLVSVAYDEVAQP